MSKTAIIAIGVDKDPHRDATAVCATPRLPMFAAIRLFLQSTLQTGRLPIEKTLNDRTLVAFGEPREIRRERAEHLRS